MKLCLKTGAETEMPLQTALPNCMPNVVLNQAAGNSNNT